MIFENRYKIKVYLEGSNVPQVEFFVICQQARLVDHKTVSCDGNIISFAENQYLSMEEVHN